MRSRFRQNSLLVTILLVVSTYLVTIQNQAEAAGSKIKPTPSPTIDPILYQGSGTSITISAAVLVLIVIFGVVFTLMRQKQS